jgi:SET domain-containing protein
MKRELQELKTRFDTKFLELDKSKIRGAGYGVFAKRDLKPGMKLGIYAGEVISEEDALQREDRTYFFRVNHGSGGSHIVDARDNNYANILKFINGVKSSRQRKRQNCVSYQYKSAIYYKTVSEVKAGEELLLDYGDDYWEEEESDNNEEDPIKRV